MSDDIEVELALGDLVEINICEENLLAIAHRAGENLPERSDDAAPATADDIVGFPRQLVRKIGREITPDLLVITAVYLMVTKPGL